MAVLLMILLVVYIGVKAPMTVHGAGNSPSPGMSAISVEDAQQVEERIDSLPDNWPAGPLIDSECAVVMDADTGVILYAKNATKEHYPASTTKIMTALLAIEHGSLTDTVRFSNAAVNDLPLGSSHIAMKVGEEVSLEDCLYGLLLPSANEVANALAEYTAGSVAAFADQMNERAARIGTVNTHFVNPTGLHDEDHYTCAYDLAIIMQECLKNDVFRSIDSAATYTIPATNKHTETRPIGSTHGMLRKNSEYYDSRVIGGKTGWTEQSGRNLVTYACENGIELIIVTLGAETPEQYTDTKKLMDFAFSSFEILDPGKEDSAYGGGNQDSPLHFSRETVRLYSLEEKGHVTVPKGTSFGDLVSKETFDEDSGAFVSYYDQGYYVGGAEIIQKDASEIVLNTENILLPEEITRLHYLNLWYPVIGIAGIVLAGMLFWFVRNAMRRRQGISFRKKRRSKKR